MSLVTTTYCGCLLSFEYHFIVTPLFSYNVIDFFITVGHNITNIWHATNSHRQSIIRTKLESLRYLPSRILTHVHGYRWNWPHCRHITLTLISLSSLFKTMPVECHATPSFAFAGHVATTSRSLLLHYAWSSPLISRQYLILLYWPRYAFSLG